MSIIRRNIPTEFLTKNYMDKNLQAALYPLYMVQSLLAISKFSIKNNIITPRASHIKSCVGAIVLVLLHFIRFLYVSFVLENINLTLNNFISIAILLETLLYIIASISFYIVGYLHSCNIVLLITKLQHILTAINLDKNMFKMKIWNWIEIITVFFIHVMYAVWKGVVDVGFQVAMIHLLLTIPIIVIDLDIVVAKRNIKVLTNNLKIWNGKMNFLRQLNDQDEIGTSNLTEKAMFNVYLDIVTAFHLVSKIDQFMVTFSVINSTIHILVNLQIMIDFWSTGREAFFYSLFIVRLVDACWILKNVFLLTNTCIACEEFYGNIRVAEYFCAQILTEKPASGWRKVCKNVLRYNRAAFRKMSAFGAFEVDAALPLKLLAAVVAYTVVLLQFALL